MAVPRNHAIAAPLRLRWAMLAVLLLCALGGTGSAVAQAPDVALRFSGTLTLGLPSSAFIGQAASFCGANGPSGSPCHPAPLGTPITIVNGDSLVALTVCGAGTVIDAQGHFTATVPLSAADACITNGAPTAAQCRDAGQIGFIFVVNGENAGGACGPRTVGGGGQVTLAATDLPYTPPTDSAYATLPTIRFMGRAALSGAAQATPDQYDQASELPPAPQGTTLYAYAITNRADGGFAYCGSGQVYDGQGDYYIDAQYQSSNCAPDSNSFLLESGAPYFRLLDILCIIFDPNDGASWGRPEPKKLVVDLGAPPDGLPDPVTPPQPWPTQPDVPPEQPVTPPSGNPPQPQPPAPACAVTPAQTQGLYQAVLATQPLGVTDQASNPLRLKSATLRDQGVTVVLMGTVDSTWRPQDEVEITITQGGFTGYSGRDGVDFGPLNLNRAFTINVSLCNSPSAVFVAGRAIATETLYYQDGTEDKFTFPITIRAGSAP